MCDECTWHHKIFLVQSVYWHLAINVYCIVYCIKLFTHYVSFTSLSPYVPVTLTNCPHDVVVVFASSPVSHTFTHTHTHHTLSLTDRCTHTPLSLFHTHTHTHTPFSLSLSHTHTHTYHRHHTDLKQYRVVHHFKVQLLRLHIKCDVFPFVEWHLKTARRKEGIRSLLNTTATNCHKHHTDRAEKRMDGVNPLPDTSDRESALLLQVPSKKADVPLVEFMYRVFTCMPGESYCRWLGSLLLYLCYVFQVLSNSLVCWSFQEQSQKSDICSTWGYTNLELKQAVVWTLHKQMGKALPIQ